MKTVGLLGGMSWESTVPHYQTIKRIVGQRLGGLHSAGILLYSVDFAEIERLQHAERWNEAGELLARAGRTLEASGRFPRSVHEHDARGRTADRGGHGHSAAPHRSSLRNGAGVVDAPGRRGYVVGP